MGTAVVFSQLVACPLCVCMCVCVCVRVRACGAVAILGLTVVCWRCCQSLNIAEFPSVRIRMRCILDFDLGSRKP